MTRRWTNMPDASDVAYTPPPGCCFDPLTVQEAFDQLIHVGSLVAVKRDGAMVTGYCDLVKYNTEEVSIGYLYKVNA